MTLTRGQYRKRLEIELSEQYGLIAAKTDIVKIRKLAARLS